MNTNGLIVGLAVGVPSAIVLGIVFLFWMRAQRREKHDDSKFDDIDIGLRDDESFDHFKDELNKPFSAKTVDPNAIHAVDLDEDSHNKSGSGSGTVTGSTDKPFSSGPDSNESSSTIEGRTRNAPRAGLHGKTASSYDFYESFIPVLPGKPGSATGTTTPSGINSVDGPTGHQHTGQESIHTASSGSSTTPAVQREVSLGNLAKQLHSPAFFEKLPTRLPSVALKSQRGPQPPHLAMKNHNSSADLVFSEGAGAINDHFTYEATTIDINRERSIKHNGAAAAPHELQIHDLESIDEPSIHGHAYAAFTRSPSTDQMGSPFEDRNEASFK